MGLLLCTRRVDEQQQVRTTFCWTKRLSMYSKQEVSQLRQEFYTSLGRYMTPILSADGEKINWINYKTGEKHVFFRIDADQRLASIAIEITHPSLTEQKLFFDQFLKQKYILEDIIGEPWEWALHIAGPHHKILSRIHKDIAPINIYNKEDWPQLISFFKPRLIALDEYWSMARYNFKNLE